MWVLLVLVAGVCAAGRPPPLAVPRCCRAGEALTLAALPAVPAPAHVPAACLPATTAWSVRVYAPARGAFLEPGRLPPHWRVQDAALPDCEELRALPDHSAAFALLANNGSLLLRGAARALPPPRYCAEPGGALVCAEDVPAAPTKCCGAGRAWDGSRCVEDAVASEAAAAELRALLGVDAAGGWPACALAEYVDRGPLSDATAAGGGSLRAGGALLVVGAWCAEARAGTGGGARVLSCATGAAGAGVRAPLYGAALAVGALFLAATLAGSMRLRAAPHALHWRCQTHYVAALMLGDALLAGTQLAGAAVPPTLCKVLAVAMHFLFLSAFFWLNTMCFNIWWTFRDFRPTSLERGGEVRRLRIYSLYAWGAPAALAAAAGALDVAGGTLRPRYGERRCWFYGDTEILVYFFGPVGVLLAINLALFASTARQLTCGLWRRDELKSTSERAALGRVCAKLVVVMGVTWGADLLSWAAGGPDYVWYATDLLNALQGVLIFAVVGWRGLRGACRTRRDAPPSCGESLTHTAQPTAPTSAPASTATPAPNPAPPAPQKVPMETVC